ARSAANQVRDACHHDVRQAAYLRHQLSRRSTTRGRHQASTILFVAAALTIAASTIAAEGGCRLCVPAPMGERPASAVEQPLQGQPLGGSSSTPHSRGWTLQPAGDVPPIEACRSDAHYVESAPGWAH